MVGTALTVMVLAFFGLRLVGWARVTASGWGRARVALVVRGIRWRHLWPVPFVLSGVLSTAVALLQVPGLSWGWWTALGGQGNPVTGVSDTTTGTPLEWLIPLVFLTLLVPALPLLAWREEEIFRAGAEHWSWPRRAGKAVLFGLAHALVGLPLAVALALSVGGAYFTACYLRGVRHGGSQAGVLESTRAHSVYNGCIVVLVLVAVLLSTVSQG